jgi:hypothetical protein
MKYKVHWTKRYFAAGSVIVEADSEDHAHRIVHPKLFTLEGNMYHDPNGDEIGAVEEVSDEPI